MKTRIEKDALGEKKIPAAAYYGVQTLRAIENFPISGLMPKKSFVDATVQIKKAAAIVNNNLGLLKPEIAGAMVSAADEVLEGALREWFVVDVYQAGAGTSHHMNVNEVIANRAIELLGGEKGDYQIVHPNDHVNMGQSTNDVVPTAIRIAAIMEGQELLAVLRKTELTIGKKAKEFDSIIKSGRTHLQDAVPIRLGQEIKAWEINIKKHRESISRALDSCSELGIGGTAVGTGLNSHSQYRKLMIQQLSKQVKIRFKMAGDYFEAMQSQRPVVELSGAIRNLTQDLIRIANDIRLLSSGPKTGLSEINLMPVQPGSSIMPGKVNPVIAEMLNMVCFQVIGCDTTILMAAQAGQLELNIMMPVIAYNLLHEIDILSNAVGVFDKLCIAKMTANPDRCREYAEKSMSIVTTLNPVIGYSKASEIAKEYLKSNKTMKELILEKNLVSSRELEKIFDLRKMTEPGLPK